LVHDHQTRSAAKEDFIGGRLRDARLRGRIEDGQQDGGLLGGRLCPTTQLRHARGLLGKQGVQQATGDGQADPFRLGGGREAGEVVGAEDQRLVQLSLESVPVGAEVIVLVLEVLKPLAGVGTAHGLKHFGRIAVKGLA
jgi:hypothetical protein